MYVCKVIARRAAVGLSGNAGRVGQPKAIIGYKITVFVSLQYRRTSIKCYAKELISFKFEFILSLTVYET